MTEAGIACRIRPVVLSKWGELDKSKVIAGIYRKTALFLVSICVFCSRSCFWIGWNSGIELQAQGNQFSLKSYNTLYLITMTITIQVVDVETGEKFGPNQVGEICLQTPFMLKEYLNNPQV